MNSRYLQYWGPVLEALKKLGGTGSPDEVYEMVVKALSIPETQLEEVTKTGVLRVKNDIHWARNSLRELGYIDASVRGVWRLTEKGQSATLSLDESRNLLAAIRASRSKERKSETITLEEDEQPILADSAPTLIETILTLPPAGFERLCQRILREAGFSEVVVTGKSGDGGIDGHGILQVNELVSFRVLFQCKRYQAAVGPSTVRDFRGAMQGRADKGIILTTASFTREASLEATRDGAPPVELVDGQRLCHLMERLELGVRPRMVFDVDLAFFDEYSH